LLGNSSTFDAAILDLGLTNMSVVEVVRAWRQAGRETPVLILSVRGTWTEKVHCLNAGADDYITKPFHIEEIVARLRTRLRRSASKSLSTLVHDTVELSPTLGTVTVAGRPTQEFRILNYFMRHRKSFRSRNFLITFIRPGASEIPISLKSTLRAWLGREIIKTSRGRGYRFG
jgi:two-component system OmpR family response regulator